MRVLTLNLWALGGDWPTRRRALLVGLAELEPDILCLQESIVLDRYDQARDLLGDGFHLHHQARRAPDGMGVSLASRWPFRRTEELDLRLTERSRRPPTGDFPAGALLAEVEAAPEIGPVVIVNHFPSYQVEFEHERELQAVVVARAVEEFARGAVRHVVVAGDLDADPASASIRFWTGRQSLEELSVCYRDAWESIHPGEPGETFTPRNPLVSAPDWPFRRIDYVLVRCAEQGSPSLAISDCRLAFDEQIEGAWASDHFGVLAELLPRR